MDIESLAFLNGPRDARLTLKRHRLRNRSTASASTPLAQAVASRVIILVTGWPGSGKTTMARKLAAEFGLIHHSVDIEVGHETKNPGPPIIYIPQNLGWSEGSQYAVDHWMGQLDNVVIEGNAIPRVLRKWSKENPGKAPPCDRIIWLTTNHRPIGDGQRAMGKGHDTVLREILPWLRRHIEIETPG